MTRLGRFNLPSEDILKSMLSEEQYKITRLGGTEPPFLNAYWNNHEEGIYVDVVTGEILFTSKAKFDSGTGWPSFTEPLFSGSLVMVADRTLGMERTEVRSASSGFHLGHVFNDGPPPAFTRYCMNSAALRFIPKTELENLNYGHYSYLFGGIASILFCAGCFWAVEDAFRKLPGVQRSTSGYSGGHTQNPTYEDVCSGNSGHAETVRVDFNEGDISIESLLKKFWEIHDPTSLNRQGPDIGTQYRSAIFVSSPSHLQKALASREALSKSGRFFRPVVTEIYPAGPFYMAEDYHQRYLEKRRSKLGY